MSEHGTSSLRSRSIYNRALVQFHKCACYSCLRRFLGRTIKEWTDDNQTAICPHCGVDAVIPDTSVVTDELLRRMQRDAFSLDGRP